jgi:hypothetical protein
MLACGLHYTLVPLHVVHLKLRMPASEKFMQRLTVLTLLFLLIALPVFGRGSHSHSSYRSHRSTGTAACCSRKTSDLRVHGYTKKNGRVVHPYHRTHQNGTQRDNFSTKGDVNPYTGKVGTKKATH